MIPHRAMNSLAFVTSLLFYFSVFPLVLTDNYLVVFGPETGSQMITITSAAEAMIERNHSVTLLTAEALEEAIRKTLPNRNYTLESYESSITINTFRDIQKEMTGFGLKGNYFEMAKVMSQKVPGIFQKMCSDLFSDEGLLKRLDGQNFDLVFAHAIFTFPILLAQHLDVRFVSITPAIPPSMHIRLYGSPVNPAYSPEILTGYSNRMSFPERVKNTLLSALQWMLAEIPLKDFDEIKRKYNIKPEISTFQSLSQAEIWFITSHFVLDFPRPYQPNTVSVGGITAKPPKPLPKDLEDFMQSSGDEGVIIFSMGSYINAMETSMADMFAEAFGKLPQKVIWKSAGQPPSTIPPNVKMAKWLPQNDILGHPKTRAMIYHCGLNGVFEAIHHAVPVICIPVLGDQWDNAKRLEVKGVGLELKLFTLTSEAVVEAVEKIIEDKSYQSNMTRLSAIFHDEHLPAPHRVVYWMEKVVRHGGAGHLRTSAFELNAIQYNLLDVIAFLVIVVAIVTFIVAYISILSCRFLLRCCKGSKKSKSE